MNTILIVEDEFTIQEMLTTYLESHGYRIISAYDGLDAEARIENESIDLVLLDWMLPKKSGLTLLKELKSHPTHKQIPVIMVSAKAEVDDRVEGLDVGADDYLTKPFVLKELLSRVKALLRRVEEYQEVDTDREILTFGALVIDLAAHRVIYHEEELEMGRMEFKLLAFLAQNPDRVYSRSQLLDHVWGDDNYVDERTVDVAIGRLRKALDKSGAGKLIQTVRGAGYRFSEEG